MKKLLCIVSGMAAGGAETFLMKMYRSLPRDDYQMDFCVATNKKEFYDDEIIKMGGNIIYRSKKIKNPLKSFYDIYKVVKKEKYENVIRISQHSLSSIDLIAAKFGGAKNLIFRSSNSNSCGNIFNRLMHIFFRPLAQIIPNKKIAPSDVAAIHLFGKKDYKNGKVVLLKNGLPLENFKFDKEKRFELRNRFGVQNDFVIGHVGRFSEQKNHKFLIEIFEDFKKKNPNSKLILIGDGPLKKEIEEYATSKGFKEDILFLGIRNDVHDIYSCMDCLVFPSLYEGMPNTVIEAQTSGLPCVISNTITTEVNLTGKVEFCSIKDSSSWVEKIKKTEDREEDYKILKEKGYDIADIVNEFIKICYI